MARFHINPNSGEVSACKAQQGKCPFGGDAKHFPSAEDARKAYEDSMKSVVVGVAARRIGVAAATEPRPQFEWTETKLTGRELRSGMEVQVKGAYLPVRGEPKYGYKYAAVVVPDLKKGERTINVLLDDSVEVRVRVETQESVDARRAARKENDCALALTNFRARREGVVADITSTVNAGHSLSTTHIRRLVEAEAHDTVMAEYRKYCEWVLTHKPEEPHPHSAAEAELKEEFQGEILRSASRGNSVSTDEATNLFERAVAAAKADFVRRGVAHF